MAEDGAPAALSPDALSENGLYAIGAWFCDQHPELVDDVLADSEAIEADGLEAWGAREGIDPDDAVRTLVTGLAIRLYVALSGGRTTVG